MRSALLRDLSDRALIRDHTDLEQLDAHLGEPTTARRTIYIGFDPTADSLHVGSLLPLLALRRVQLAGHRPIVLVGGGTGLIGDPSGKAGERALNPEKQVGAWAERLATQARRFLDFGRGRSDALLVNNYEWLSRLKVIPFLRDVGKHFAVGSMIARESVKARMETGISYTEFSYQVLQAWDFVELCRRYDCTVQMGGSDQWGNITAGIDLIRRLTGRSAHGLTLPLVTKTDGGKFGKTEGGTVWLDPARTTPYDMYQFWLNTADADVVRFLYWFTFLDRDEIEHLRLATSQAPEKREAQRALARAVTRLVHGEQTVRDAEEAAARLRSGEAASLTPGGEGGAVPGAVLAAEASTWPIWRVLKEAGLVPSTSEARRLIQQGGVRVNGERVEDPGRTLAAGGHTLRLGKRRIFRIVIQP
jgi:tyrosyl-tRNA synthetase